MKNKMRLTPTPLHKTWSGATCHPRAFCHSRESGGPVFIAIFALALMLTAACQGDINLNNQNCISNDGSGDCSAANTQTQTSKTGVGVGDLGDDEAPTIDPAKATAANAELIAIDGIPVQPGVCTCPEY
jgi:hypothetical protein